jgi:hypothetical protein
MATDWRVELTRTYGKTYAHPTPFFVKSPRTICISQPKDVEHILKTAFHNYTKPWLFEVLFTELVGNGIFQAAHAHCKVASNMRTCAMLTDITISVPCRITENRGGFKEKLLPGFSQDETLRTAS